MVLFSSFCFFFFCFFFFSFINLFCHISIIQGEVVSVSNNTVSFDVFAVHEIRSNFHGNHIFVASSFFHSCFEIVQALYLHTSMGSIQLSRAPLLVWMEMYLFFNTHFNFHFLETQFCLRHSRCNFMFLSIAWYSNI